MRGLVCALVNIEKRVLKGKIFEDSPTLLAFVALLVSIAATLVLSPVIWFIFFLWSNAVGGKAFDFLAPQIIGTLPYIYVGVAGIFTTLLTIAMSLKISRDNQRKQDTLKILSESYISRYYMSLGESAAKHFPTGEKASVSKYLNPENSEQEASANALLKILNYYEFLCAGINQGNLDEEMLKETIRGIFCSLVFDARDIIAADRKESNSRKVWENLVSVYIRWANRDSKDEWGEEVMAKLLPDSSP